MLTCLLLLGAVLGNLLGSSTPLFSEHDTLRSMSERFLAYVVKPGLPSVYHEDAREKSFVSQVHNTVRLPFGNNPHEKELNASAMFQSDKYRKRYQKNIREMTVQNQDWRLDGNFIGAINSYADVHMPEFDNIHQILNCGNKRRQGYQLLQFK